MKSKLIITLTALLMLGGISAMAQGSFPKGDINEDGVVNAADIVALANIIMNGEEPSGGTKYYWYAGTTLPTANNIASIALGSSNTIEKWDGKEFSITNSGEEATPAYVCTPVDFKVSWKDMNGFTLNLVEVEGAGFTLNGIEYKVQKKGRDLSAGAELTCLGYYTDYWYVGNVEPTAATNPVTESGWTALYSKPEQIKIFKEDPNWNDVQWYLAAPAEWGFETTVNGIQVGGWTKTTITINHVSYNVWTAQSLTDTVNVTLANVDN